MGFACVTRDVIKTAGKAPSIDPKGLDGDVIHNAHSPCVCASKTANVIDLIFLEICLVMHNYGRPVFDDFCISVQEINL